MHRTRLISALVLPLALAACGDPTGGSGAPVSVRFTRMAPTMSLASGASFSRASADAPLVVRGTNGTLSITNVSFIASEVELKCADKDDSASSCEKFKAAPSFVNLPLTSGSVNVATANVPAGSYDELEFQVENLEADADDDAAKSKQIADLFASIRATRPDFPSRASMVVEGSFTPTGSTTATPFRAYFAAELEMELRLDPVLTISDAGASRALSVDVDPSLWFKNSDGTVRDLSRLDYATTHALVGFEVEMHKGFARVEHD